MVTLTLVFCGTCVINQYDISSQTSDNVNYCNVSACVLSTHHDVSMLDNSAGQRVVNLPKVTSTEARSDLAKTPPPAQLPEHKTAEREKPKIPEKEKPKTPEKESEKLAVLAVFVLVSGILLYKMKFKEEDNGNVERLNKDPEGNELSGGSNDNGFSKLFLLSIVSILAPVEGLK